MLMTVRSFRVTSLF